LNNTLTQSLAQNPISLHSLLQKYTLGLLKKKISIRKMREIAERVKVVVHLYLCMDWILKESETGMKNSRLLRLSLRRMPHREHKETELL